MSRHSPSSAIVSSCSILLALALLAPPLLVTFLAPFAPAATGLPFPKRICIACTFLSSPSPPAHSRRSSHPCSSMAVMLPSSRRIRR
ncbi:hypothetical protein M422DRAFT_39242, partial [Sphaerobolus stellatus SS14]